MEKLVRNTRVKCSACGEDIHVKYTFRVKSLVPPHQMRIGGRNPVSKSVESIFFCSNCGLEFQPTEKNKIKRADPEILLDIFSNYYSLELNGELDSKKFSSEHTNRKILSTDLTYLGRYKENNFGLLRDSDGMFLKIFKTKDAVLWNLYSELHERHKQKSLELRKKLQAKLNANQIDAAFKFAEKHNFSLRWTGMNFVKYKNGEGGINRPKDGKKYMIGTPIGYTSSTFVSTPKVPANAVPASKIFILEEDLSLSEYWIPKEFIKTK